LDPHHEPFARAAIKVDDDRVGRVVGELLEVRRPFRRDDVDLFGESSKMLRDCFCGVRRPADQDDPQRG
jgi:hypothetical protein